jgi:peptidoglycan/LPS O-acetylase OafA/YrhL
MTTSLVDTTVGKPEPTRSSVDQVRLPKADASLTSRGDRRFRPDIQGLRAVAVLLVVLYHAKVPGIPGGYIGVDVFFVISGFLITRQLITESGRSGTVSLSRFYARRIRRLLPSALLVIVVTIIAARVWGPAIQATSVARDGFFASLYSINYWLAFQGVDYQHAASAVSPLQHFWSLAVEEQFYIIWPVLILIAVLVTRGPLKRARPAALFVVIGAIGAASLWQSTTVTPVDAPLAYFSLQTRGWELAVGAIIAVCIPLLSRVPGVLAAIMSWTGIALIVYSAIVFTDSTQFPGTAAIVPVAGAALIIAAGLLEHRGGAEMWLRKRPMQFLGSVSYGWYLWHWPAIVLAPFLFRSVFGWPENLEVSFLALWFATITFLTIERPRSRATVSRKRWFTIGASLTAFTAVLALVLSLVVPSSLAGLGAAVRTLDLTGVQSPAKTLAADLTAASHSRKLPVNLTPSLASAASDVPVTTPDGCHLGYTQTRNPSCVYGDTTAKRTVLVFGDSHAEQWFGAINAYAKAEHLRLVYWTKAACPVADVVLRVPQLNRDYTECGTWRTQTLKRIANMHPDMIIASQADNLAGADYSNATWSAETASTLSRLQGMTSSLVFIADTPHPTSDVPACLASHRADASLCNLPAYPAGSDEYLTARRAAVIAATTALKLPVINPTKWFCTKTTCPAVVENTLVYRDDSHMTQAYSRALEPVLSAAISPLMTASGTSK